MHTPLPSEALFDLTVQVFPAVVRSGQTDDVVAVKEPRPVAFAHREKVLSKPGQPGAEVGPIG